MPQIPQQAPAAVNNAYQPSQFQTQPILQHQQYPGQVPVQQLQGQPQKAPTPEPPKPKPPLPEEYVYLQTVFNELRVECINHANNPVSNYRTDRHQIQFISIT